MNNFMAFLNRNKPGIFLGLGIGNMLAATGLTVSCTLMAKEALDAKREELETDSLDGKEIVRTAGPYFIPPLVFSVAGITLILCGNHITAERGAAAMAAYAMSESAFREYRNKTREIVGAKKEKDIKEAVAKDVVERNPVQSGSIIITGNGDCLCFDNVANQYFRSNKVKIESMINEINYDMLHGRDIISLNEYCIRLGLDEVELGNNLGWDISSNGLIDVTFTAVIAKNGEPCLSVVHNTTPKEIH